MNFLISGQHVMIQNQKLGIDVVEEGEAELLRLLNNDSQSEYWTVKFKSDSYVTERWIDVDYNPTSEETRTPEQKGWRRGC